MATDSHDHKENKKVIKENYDQEKLYFVIYYFHMKAFFYKF